MLIHIRQVACFTLFALLSFPLSAYSGSKNSAQQLPLPNLILSQQIDDNTVAKLLWTNCRLELINTREATKDYAYNFGRPELIHRNEVIFKSRFSATLKIKKALRVLEPQAKQTLLDCGRKMNLLFVESDEEINSMPWYTKYVGSLFSTSSAIRRRELLQDSAPTPAPAPAPSLGVASPTFSPRPSSSKVDFSQNPAGPPLDHFLPTDESSPKSVTDGSSPTVSSSSSNKENKNRKIIVVAVAVTASVTFFIVALLFLCYYKVCAIRPGVGAGQNDDSPLLHVSLGNYSIGSFEKSFPSENLINVGRPSNHSFHTNVTNYEAGVLSTSEIGIPLEMVSDFSVTTDDESATKEHSPIMFAPSGSTIEKLPPLKYPSGRAKHSELPSPGKGAPPPLPGKGAPPPLPGKGAPPPLPGKGAPPSLPGKGAPPSLPGKGDPAVPGKRDPPPPPVPGKGTPPPPPVLPSSSKPSSGSPLLPHPGPPPPPIPSTIKAVPHPPQPPGSSIAPPRPPTIGLRPPRPSPYGLNYPSLSIPASAEEGEADAPKAKLKPFFWDKVLANPDHSMVWHQIKSGSFQFDEEMIESLFGAPAGKNRKETKKESPSQDPSTQYIQIIDPKKSQNLSILLKALNVTTEELCEAILEGNELPSELLETLLKMAPTAEEEQKLRLYSGELTQLGTAERFLKVLVDVPFAFKRLESLLYMCTLQEEASIIKESLVTLEAACAELKKSRLFLKLLEAVLKTGNRMNDGTFRGGAQAFKLDTLLKLSDVKGADGKTTLLHFVVQEIIRSEGVRAARVARESQKLHNIKIDFEGSSHDMENHYRGLGLQVVSGLGDELENVKKAAGLDADNLMETVAKLGNGLVKIKEFLNTGMKNIDKVDRFHHVLQSFVQNAEVDMMWLFEEERRIMTLVKSTADYFHGHTEKNEGLRLFVIVRDFLLILNKSCKEVKDAQKKTNKTTRKEDSIKTLASSSEPRQASHPEPQQLLFPAIGGKRILSSSSDEDSS